MVCKDSKLSDVMTDQLSLLSDALTTDTLVVEERESISWERKYRKKETLQLPLATCQKCSPTYA